MEAYGVRGSGGILKLGLVAIVDLDSVREREGGYGKGDSDLRYLFRYQLVRMLRRENPAIK